MRQWEASHCLPIQQPSSDPRTSPRRRETPGQPEPLGCRPLPRSPEVQLVLVLLDVVLIVGLHPPYSPRYLLDEKLTPLVLLHLTPEHLRHVLLVDCNECPRLPVQVLYAGQLGPAPLHPPDQRCRCASRQSTLARRPSSIATSTSPATCSATHRASRTLSGPWKLMSSRWSVAVRVARSTSGCATGPASIPSGRAPSDAQKRNQAPQSSYEACQRLAACTRRSSHCKNSTMVSTVDWWLLESVHVTFAGRASAGSGLAVFPSQTICPTSGAPVHRTRHQRCHNPLVVADELHPLCTRIAQSPPCRRQDPEA